MDPLYKVNIVCLYCKSPYNTMRVRSSFQRSYKQDSDFCPYYKELNPNYYIVRVCPVCGFASTENFSPHMKDSHVVAIKRKVSDHWTNQDLGQERTWDDALRSFKLALVCAQLKEEKDRLIAGLLHHIAWLYRLNGDTAQEERFIRFALDSYIRVYEVEEAELNNAKLMYIIGELHRRLGQYREAVMWFSRVINDKRIMDAAIIRACREQWAATREDMQKANIDIPQDAIIE